MGLRCRGRQGGGELWWGLADSVSLNSNIPADESDVCCEWQRPILSAGMCVLNKSVAIFWAVNM